MNNKLLTIAEIAKELNIPESTARYYRDRFLDYIPYVGKGRGKRYRPETIEILRFIAEGFNRNLTATDIEEGLSLMVARNIEIEQPTAMTAATAQQQLDPSIIIELAGQFQKAMGQIANAMEVVAHQKEEIAELRKHVTELEEKQQEQNQYIENALKERDQKLVKAIREIQETRLQLVAAEQEKQKKRWWQFWK